MFLKSHNLLKIACWIFILYVLLQAIYSGLKFGCWGGLITLVIGFIGGVIYARIKKHKPKI